MMMRTKEMKKRMVRFDRTVGIDLELQMKKLEKLFCWIFCLGQICWCIPILGVMDLRGSGRRLFASFIYIILMDLDPMLLRLHMFIFLHFYIDDRIRVQFTSIVKSHG